MFPDENKTPCENGITISKRQASILVALFLFLSLTVFVIGYFLGKKSMLDSLTDSFEQEIEKIDQYSSNPEPFDGASSVTSGMRDFAFDDSSNEEKTAPVEAQAIEPEPPQEIVEEKIAKVPVKAYAQLIGFGSKQTATAFKNRLAKKKIDVNIKTRTSRTAKGRKRTWYQAVTPVFTSFEELERTIKKIQKLEYIRTKDINIVHIKEQED